MQTYLKTRTVWSQSAIFISLVVSGLLIFVAMLGTWLSVKVTGLSLFQIGDVSNWNLEDPRYVLFLRVMLVMQFLGLFLIPVLVFAYLSDPTPAWYLGFRKTKPLYWVLGVVVLLAALPFVEYIGYLNQKIQFPTGVAGWMKNAEKDAQQQIGLLLKNRTPANLLLNIFLVAGFAAVGEELFFRGVLQRLFIWGFKNVWVGIILAAVLFSALHLQFYGFFPRFLLGVLLGAIYWYSGSIVPAMLAHFVYDASLLIAAYFNPSMITESESSLLPPGSLLLAGIVSAIVTALLVLYMRKRSTASKEAFLAERRLEPTESFSFDN